VSVADWESVLDRLRLRATLILLEHGADPNDCTLNGTTALMLACIKGDLELVELLIANGADARIANATHYTPLLAAGLAGKLPTIRYLLANSHASVAERNKRGGSVLLYACREGSVECLEFLLSQGASLDETDDRVRAVYRYHSVVSLVVSWVVMAYMFSSIRASHRWSMLQRRATWRWSSGC
jgi:ankyrin repeat protein